jgi:hypothetical protein
VEAVAARKAAFDAELERQREDERLCVEFAGLIKPFVDNIGTPGLHTCALACSDL